MLLDRLEDDGEATPGLRRGIAGDVLIIKIAGGVAAVSQDLDEIVRVTTKAVENTRSMGMALSAGSLPETGEPTFILADDEIGIGMGVHGEQGVGNRKMMPADAIVDQMMGPILADLPFVSGDEVCLLINNMGATTMMELLIVNRKIRQNLVLTFLYNAVSIPVAMSGLLSPLVAVCAMLLSSLSVIGNTYLLVRKHS